MKKYLRISGWIFVGVLLQFQFDLLYRIVVLENLSFHERAYTVKANLLPVSENLRILHIETTVNYSLGPDYFAYVYIPEQYKVLNKTVHLGTETIAGYKPYRMNMRRKYRDVLASEDLIIIPRNPGTDIQQVPIEIHFENLRQRLHIDKTYLLSTFGKDTRLDGPPEVAAKYPQQVGL